MMVVYRKSNSISRLLLAMIVALTAFPFVNVNLVSTVNAVALETSASELFRKHCVACHGSDVQESGLRLDSKEFTLRGGDSGAVVDSEMPDHSLLVMRIRSKDREFQMPPEGTRLSEVEITTIETWIANGMPWEDETKNESWREHWAYKPLVKPDVPAVKKQDWIINPVDAFVLDRLEENGFEPAPRASATTLLRRLHFNLIGLPPTPEQMAELQKIGNPLNQTQYVEIAERLLNSPQFGEKWARHWLDVVRFAESDGFETNQPRPNAWRYRDYVIDAFNSDKPYNQFVREQIAGDQFGIDEATGFLVGGPWDRVKSPDPVLTANQRADELHDMVSTTGSAFLGLTVGCARCHSHKFDPISQVDYYSIKAALAGVQHGDRPLRSGRQEEREAKALAMRERLKTIRTQLEAYEAVATAEKPILMDDLSANGFESMIEHSGRAEYPAGNDRGEADQSVQRFGTPNFGRQYTWWQAKPKQYVASYSPRVNGRYRVWISWGAGWATHGQDVLYVVDHDGNIETPDDQQVLATVDQRRFSDRTEIQQNKSLWSGFQDCGVADLRSTSKLFIRSGEQASAVTADVVCFEPESIRQLSAANIPRIRSSVSSQYNSEKVQPSSVRFLKLEISATSSGSEPCIDELMCFDLGGKNVARNAKLTSSGDYSGNAFHRLEHLNDGILGNEKSWISNMPGKGMIQLEFSEEVTLQRIQWSRDGSSSPRYQDRVMTQYLFYGSRNGSDWFPICGSNDRVPVDYPHAIKPFQKYEIGNGDEGTIAALIEERNHLDGELKQLDLQPMVYAGRFEKPVAVHRLSRGDPMQPREVVKPASIESIGVRWELPEDAEDARRRMKLADWIASEQNPLTARVIVNRLWHYHFGIGLVETPSDFGINGGVPTHPELIDWLAYELIESGWSLKHIHRLIIQSSTYQQRGKSNQLSSSPDRLLGAYPSRRMDAETLRDSLLSITGVLRNEQGGPGFDLFEPNTNYVKVYNSKALPGNDTWRRMVYQSKPRMQLDNTFGAFDCPDAGQVAPRRGRSVNPLQALSLFNSPFMLEQASFLSRRLRMSSQMPEEQVRYAFKLAFTREPENDELEWSLQFVRDEGLDSFCRAILNTSEWMYIE